MMKSPNIEAILQVKKHVFLFHVLMGKYRWKLIKSPVHDEWIPGFSQAAATAMIVIRNDNISFSYIELRVTLYI